MFYKRSGAPLDLHSFPTRRSSDLNNHAVITLTGTVGVLSGVVLNNPSGTTFDIAADAGFSYLGGTVSTFNNGGKPKKSEGTGASSSTALALKHSGLIDVQSGTLAI